MARRLFERHRVSRASLRASERTGSDDVEDGAPLDHRPRRRIRRYVVVAVVLVAAMSIIAAVAFRSALSGWSFVSRSVGELAATLRRVAALPDADVAAAGMAARRHVEHEFSPRSYLDRIRGVYGRLGVEWP